VQICNRLSKSFGWSSATAVLVLLLSSSLLWGQSGKAAPKVPVTKSSKPTGSWTAPAMLCPTDGNCVVGANLALMHNGTVLFYYFPRPGSGPGSRAAVLDPNTGIVTDALMTASRDIFCSGINIMPNGQVLSTGGDAPNPPNNHSGTWNTDIFDSATNTWTLGQNMNYARWYPSTIELPSGLSLEVSGSNEVGSKLQNVMETYDYHTGLWTALPATANLPNVLLDGTAYPRLTLLTSGKVFASSPSAKTYVFDAVANTWTFQSGTNFGKRYYAGHVLLPGLNKVMIAGGSPISSNGTGTTTNTAEVIDFSTKKPIWQYITPMNLARMNENLVLLPDGTVLMVGGGAGGGRFANPVLTPELYDPVAGTWTEMAPQIGTRTYHSTAAVMPDGRVLSAGSDDKGIYQQTYELYSPSYLFNGPRPTITSSPATLTYGAQFTINTPDAASITRVALMRPSATTHADDMDQRYVDLTFTIGSGQITATSPLNANYAPPGYYMLVILNSNGVPSVMPFLQIM
jgi:hypothetical protein